MVIDLVVLVDRGLLLTLPGRRIAAVIEAVSVPRRDRHLHPLDRIRERSLRRQLDDPVFLPVRTALRNPVDRIPGVLRRDERRERDGRPPDIRIDEDFGRAGQPLLDVQHALVLEPGVPAEKEVRALARRLRVLLVVVEPPDAILHGIPERNLLQVPERDGVLRLDPLERFGRVVVLEPSIRIRNLHTVIPVDLVHLARLRVLQLLRREGDRAADRQRRADGARCR